MNRISLEDYDGGLLPEVDIYAKKKLNNSINTYNALMNFYQYNNPTYDKRKKLLYNVLLSRTFNNFKEGGNISLNRTKFQVGGKEKLNEEEIKSAFNNPAVRQAYLESGFDSLAYNKKSGATGIYQITQGVIDDYNKANKTNLKLADMIHPAQARKVYDWEINELNNASWQQNPNMTDEVRRARTYYAYNAGRGTARTSLNDMAAKKINIHTNLDFVNNINQESKDYVNFMMTGQGNDVHRNYEQFKRAFLKNPDVIKQINFANGGNIRMSLSKNNRPSLRNGGLFTKKDNQNIDNNLNDNVGKKHSFRQAALNTFYNIFYKRKVDKLGIDEVRKRLYDNISPLGYSKPIRRINSAFRNEPETTNVRKLHYKFRDDIWRTYLNVPESYRHSGDNYLVSPSNYKPTKASNNNTIYHSVELEPFTKGFFVDDVLNQLKPGENTKSHVLDAYFGYHQIGRGFDSNGDYASYYDNWDLTPISKGKGGAAEDETQGIGTPIEFYDRVYFDDYYGVPKEKRGGYYLPEVTIEPEEYKSGGKIYIKPSHRGRLTELKARTGKTESELYNDGNPSHKKMVVFARNARKWNH